MNASWGPQIQRQGQYIRVETHRPVENGEVEVQERSRYPERGFQTYVGYPTGQPTSVFLGSGYQEYGHTQEIAARCVIHEPALSGRSDDYNAREHRYAYEDRNGWYHSATEHSYRQARHDHSGNEESQRRTYRRHSSRKDREQVMEMLIGKSRISHSACQLLITVDNLHDQGMENLTAKLVYKSPHSSKAKVCLFDESGQEIGIAGKHHRKRTLDRERDLFNALRQKQIEMPSYEARNNPVHSGKYTHGKTSITVEMHDDDADNDAFERYPKEGKALSSKNFVNDSGLFKYLTDQIVGHVSERFPQYSTLRVVLLSAGSPRSYWIEIFDKNNNAVMQRGQVQSTKRLALLERIEALEIDCGGW
ncbi:hypothetical protein P154DRAFT_579986 [Amniculicola lignicola CBS 123094]|uniref:Uncharacterized protein n=1 Tax=Amniculicola lignicola CBS 123094 TaxID=1392246 RepID=A0A6A5W8G0_9PLEO|nr:hypothetical protein P154DRAFT_579986 [Amniculicola lignicola CBS 123094]